VGQLNASNKTQHRYSDHSDEEKKIVEITRVNIKFPRMNQID